MPVIFFVAALAFGGIFTWAALRRPSSAVGASASAFVLLGDSLAVGLAPHLSTWAQDRGLPFSQDAKVGRFTHQQSVSSVVPNSIVFVSLGTNDATSNVDGSTLQTFAQALRARVPRAIIWLLPPATKALPGLATVRATIASLGVTVVQTTATIRADGVHPVNYKQVFQDIAPALDSALS